MEDTLNVVLVIVIIFSISGYLMYKQAKWKAAAFMGVVSNIVPKKAWRRKTGIVIGPFTSQRVVVGYKYYFKTDSGQTYKLYINNPDLSVSHGVAINLMPSLTEMPSDQAEFMKLKIGDRVQKKSGEQYPVKI